MAMRGKSADMWPNVHLGRREFLGGISSLGMGAAVLINGSGAGAWAAAPEYVTVRTTYGKLRGAAQNGIVVFKGIPYAGLSDGENRFKPPTKLKPWSGVHDALEYGPKAMQNGDPNNALSNAGPASENCHFLNVWTPGVQRNAKRPVMFYLHGGGYLTGSGGIGPNLDQDGTDLAMAHDVVVVACNHRLGAFGFLYLGGLAGEEYAIGNVGQLDIVAALQWVRDNIEEFGGDPGNVMIFGESGGARKVSVTMALAEAHGLFHKASIESLTGLRMADRDHATETTRRVLARLGLQPTQVRELLKVPAEKILEAQRAVGSGIPVSAATQVLPGWFGPVLDMHTLAANPFDQGILALSANIPMMIGNNKDESAFYLQRDPEAKQIFTLQESGLIPRVRTIMGRDAFRAIEVYRRSRPDASPTELLVAINTAEWIWANTIIAAERKAAQKAAPVYTYVFAYESETPAVEGVPYPIKAPHAGEIPFKFNHPDSNIVTGKRPERLQVAYNMSRAWASFARTGDPSHDRIPKWQPYTLQERATMFIDTRFKVVNDPWREERLFWEEVA